MKLYKSLIMEIRPRLQSVNVFLTISNEFDPQQIKINLNPDHFELIFASQSEAIPCNGFEILPQTLTCVSITQPFVSFRFQTENLHRTRGSSKFEFLTHREIIPPHRKEPIIKTDTFYKITCTNCKQLLTEEALFERVLPYPDNPDSSEWFCHAHGDDNNPNLTPKLNEVFFTHTFVHLNASLLNGLLKTASNIVCKRCLAWIGTVTDLSHKIWFNTVEFNGGKSCALQDVFMNLQEVLNGPLSSCKVVLMCQSSEKTDFVLLWVLEKRLKGCFDLGGDDGVYVGDVAKVLFKFEKERGDLVDEWLEDVNVSAVDVSKPMMVCLLEHLYNMNGFIPKDFSISNDFYVSYLMMYKKNYIK